MSGGGAEWEVEPVDCADVRDGDLVGRYLEDDLPAGEAEAFEAHYFSCEACWERLQAGLSLRAAAGEEAAGPRRRWGRWAAAAVAASLIGAVVLVWDGPATEGPGPAADGPSAGAYRGEAGTLAVEASRSGGDLSLSWEEVASAHAYVVRLFAADGRLLAERRVEGPGLELGNPPAPTAGTAGGLHAVVEARNAAGRVLVRSRPAPLPAPDR